MNRLLPEAACAEPFFRDWGALQEERLREVEEAFAPLPVLRAPLQEDEVVGVEALARHGHELFGARAPEALLGSAPRLRFTRAGSGYQLALPLPGASAAELDVSKVEGELLLSTGRTRRAIALPRRVAALALAGAKLERGRLVVRFASEAP
jgi:arsenite-transporting ATPase